MAHMYNKHFYLYANYYTRDIIMLFIIAFLIGRVNLLKQSLLNELQKLVEGNSLHRALAFASSRICIVYFFRKSSRGIK